MQARSRGSSCDATRAIVATSTAIDRGSPPRSPTPWRVAGGCDFVADPDFPSGGQPVFWSPEVYPAVLVIAAAAGRVAETLPRPPRDDTITRQAEDGEHRATKLDGTWLQTWAPRPLLPGVPIAVILPLDGLLDQRARAALRLWRALQDRPASPEPVILPLQRRERLRLALRALDAYLDHASYRQIAEGLFDRDAVATQPWKTSDVRQRIIRLVQAGTKLMQGGYLDLLIYPHRRKR